MGNSVVPLVDVTWRCQRTGSPLYQAPELVWDGRSWEGVTVELDSENPCKWWWWWWWWFCYFDDSWWYLVMLIMLLTPDHFTIMHGEFLCYFNSNPQTYITWIRFLNSQSVCALSSVWRCMNISITEGCIDRFIEPTRSFWTHYLGNLCSGRAIWTQTDAEIFLVLRLPRRPKAGWIEGQRVGDLKIIRFHTGHLIHHLSCFVCYYI